MQQFLADFKTKMGIWQIVFRDDRGKNAQALLDLEISRAFRTEVIQGLATEDYCQGPLDDTLYGGASLWVFGKPVKKKEVYIKITMGASGTSVVCISFHVAEHKLKYAFK